MSFSISLTLYSEDRENYLPTSGKTDLSLAWKNMLIIHNDARTISASFVVWQLVNLEKRIATAPEKHKNSSMNIVIISKSMPNHFKVYVWMSFHSWNKFTKFNCMPWHCRKMEQPKHCTCQHFLAPKNLHECI